MEGGGWRHRGQAFSRALRGWRWGPGREWTGPHLEGPPGQGCVCPEEPSRPVWGGPGVQRAGSRSNVLTGSKAPRLKVGAPGTGSAAHREHMAPALSHLGAAGPSRIGDPSGKRGRGAWTRRWGASRWTGEARDLPEAGDTAGARTRVRTLSRAPCQGRPPSSTVATHTLSPGGPCSPGGGCRAV